MSWFFPILVGAATGVLSGFGIGGGTLLLLWLTMVSGMDQLHAGGINLAYFIACALPALWYHLKNGLIEKKAALWCILAGVPACILASLLAARMDVTLLRRFFGVFLLGIGFRELFFKSKKGGTPNPEAVKKSTQAGEYLPLSTKKAENSKK